MLDPIRMGFGNKSVSCEMALVGRGEAIMSAAADDVAPILHQQDPEQISQDFSLSLSRSMRFKFPVLTLIGVCNQFADDTLRARLAECALE